MLNEGREQTEKIVDDSPFGLDEKDAKFARWDARRSYRRGGGQVTLRWLQIFETSSNGVLLDRMHKFHGDISRMESDNISKQQIHEKLLTEDPSLCDYYLLFQKTAWGKRLHQVLFTENYQTNKQGVLWNDFVMSRVHRALGGRMDKLRRYDGRFSYQIDTPVHVLRFDPESNAHTRDGPEIQIRGNRVEKPLVGDTNQTFMLELKKVDKVQVWETGERVIFIKSFPGEEVRLLYRLKPIGSTHQIELTSKVKE